MLTDTGLLEDIYAELGVLPFILNADTESFIENECRLAWTNDWCLAA